MKPSPCEESTKNELPNSAVPGVKIIPVCCNMHHCLDETLVFSWICGISSEN